MPGRELAQASGRSRRHGDDRCPRTRRPREPRLAPRAPPGGGAGGAEAQSRRFPAEGQQQLRSAAGEGGTRPSPTAEAPAPAQAPAPPAAHPAARPRRSEGRGRLAESSPCLPPGRCPSPASSPAAPARPSRRWALTSGCAGRDGPAEPPAAACVSAPRERSLRRLVRAAEAPSSAQSGGGSGSSQHPGPRTRNYFPTRSLPRPRRGPRLRLPRRRCATGPASAASRLLRVVAEQARGIPPRGQVVPRASGNSVFAPPVSWSGRRLRAAWGFAPPSGDWEVGAARAVWRRTARTCGLAPCPWVPRALVPGNGAS